MPKNVHYSKAIVGVFMTLKQVHLKDYQKTCTLLFVNPDRGCEQNLIIHYRLDNVYS